MELPKFNEFNELSQKVSDAIEAILQIDVTIMDKNRLRIAGTGIYSTLIGKEIEEKTIFDHCLRENREFVVLDSRKASICLKCPRLQSCIGESEICVPIQYSSETIGVIGIGAFNKSQKGKMQKNADNYLNFLRKMAYLLEGKYRELMMAQENRALENRMNKIINNIHEGLILFDNRCNTLFTNIALRNLLNDVGIHDHEHFIDTMKDQMELSSYFQPIALAAPRDWSKEIVIRYRQEQYQFYVSISLAGEDENRAELILTLQNLKKLQKRLLQSAEKNEVELNFDHIIGVSKAIRETKEYGRKAAESNSSVLIYGESGTGKEMFARAIHRSSPRKHQPFVAINCGAIPNELLESELFGYEKGAFTGASTTKYGKFEVADHGTVFLDEIGDMPLHLQVKLLRVLQEREICRIGSNQVRKVDIRIIAATNSNLPDKISKGIFREDLYYRLNIIPITLPPLRERKEDIPVLALYFLEYYNQLFHKQIQGISPEAESILMEYSWPGNIRELQNIIEYAATFEQSLLLSTDCLNRRMSPAAKPHEASSSTAPGQLPQRLPAMSPETSLEEYLRQAEAEYIQCLLEKHQNAPDQVDAICRELKISRATFYRKKKAAHQPKSPESSLNGAKTTSLE